MTRPCLTLLVSFQLAIQYGEAKIAHGLCEYKADPNALTSAGEPMLWLVLQTRQEPLAAVLVHWKCDLNAPHPETGATLLHRAIESGDSVSAVFLIRHVSTDLGWS